MAKLTELEALVAQLAAINFSQSSEQATREMAVNPLIAALGWNTFDPDEVHREYSVRGGRVDYCLRGPKGNLVLIEVNGHFLRHRARARRTQGVSWRGELKSSAAAPARRGCPKHINEGT